MDTHPNDLNSEGTNLKDMRSSPLLSIMEASKWATDYLEKPVTKCNIGYLIQYAEVKKHYEGEKVRVSRAELKRYYDEKVIRKHENWKEKLGDDLNWDLSFSHLRESDTTKHVHRLHPYKGKFIPQLVEAFLDSNPRGFKEKAFFRKGSIVLDPFMGSGTTLVQASELGMHSIGIDVSGFNCLISRVKLDDYDMPELEKAMENLLSRANSFSDGAFDGSQEKKLKEKLNEFNRAHFPNPEFKEMVRKGKIKDDRKYGEEKLRRFMRENRISEIRESSLPEKSARGFLDKWFSERIKRELRHCIKLAEEIKEEKIRNVLRVAISRTARSCRSTRHADLATLREPQQGPYYCRKHGKLCTPVGTITRHLKRYAFDTVKRLKEFSSLKKEVNSEAIHADSRNVDVFKAIRGKNRKFFNLLSDRKISGVFTSPPYVGHIDYHEQHAYAYELFGIKRKDDKEIGPLFRGQGTRAREEYVQGISRVLENVGSFVRSKGDYFIVANDKYDLYPQIAEKSGLKIIDSFKRPVLNRTEKDRQPYAEIIFHMKKE